MLKHFHIERAKACVITFDDITSINKAVIRLRKLCPKLPIIVRAKNPQHQQRLEAMFGKYYS
jgi:voltage-gated potassium channel Kch